MKKLKESLTRKITELDVFEFERIEKIWLLAIIGVGEALCICVALWLCPIRWGRPFIALLFSFDCYILGAECCLLILDKKYQHPIRNWFNFARILVFTAIAVLLVRFVCVDGQSIWRTIVTIGTIGVGIFAIAYSLDEWLLRTRQETVGDMTKTDGKWIVRYEMHGKWSSLL